MHAPSDSTSASTGEGPILPALSKRTVVAPPCAVKRSSPSQVSSTVIGGRTGVSLISPV